MTPRAEAVLNGCSNNITFTLELPTNAWKDVKVEEKTKGKALTFENERPVRIPDIVKRPRITTKFEKYAARGVGENTDWFGVVGMPIFLSRLSVEFLPIRI
jgi:hypothetical protein